MSRRALRIEMVVPSLPRAGMETMTAALVRGLAERGHEVGVTCLLEADALGEDLRAQGFQVSVVPATGVLSNFVSGTLAEWFRRRRPDVVHAHTAGWLKIATAARAAGVNRVVNTLHGFEAAAEPWLPRSLARVAVRRTDRIVAVSESVREHLLRVYRAPAERVALVLNGIPLDQFRPGTRSAGVRAALGIPQGRFVVGHVARHRAVKNQALLLDAFARFRATREDAFLVLVGDGPLRAELEQEAVRLGIARHVRFAGDVRDTAAVYREFDVFVLSSVTEGTSVSILEALASGVPVVATAVGGTPALLRGGECGVLVPSGDAETLAEALRNLAAAPDRRAVLVRRGREWVEHRYSESRMLDRYEEIYGARPAREQAQREQRERACAE